MPLMSDNIKSAAAVLTILAIVIAGLVLGQDILLPLAVAGLLAFVLAPIVRFLSAYVPEAAAVAFVMVSLIVFCIGGSTVLSNQVLSLAAELGTYRENVVEKIRVVRGAGGTDGVIGKAADAIKSLGSAIETELTSRDRNQTNAPAVNGEERPPAKVVLTGEEPDVWSEYFRPMLPFAAPLAAAALTLLFTLFLLLQHSDLRDRAIRVAGTNNMTGTTAAMSEAGSRLSQLFLTQALLNAGFGIFVSIALAIIGVPNAILWGVLAAIMRFVPFIGSIIAALPPILIAAAVDPGWSMLMATALVFIVGEPLMGHVIEPMVLGKSAGLSPFAMVLAASFWTICWGPLGLILAAPLTMTLVVLGRYISGLEFFTVMLGDEPALLPEQSFYHRMLSRDAMTAATQVEKALEDGASNTRVADKVVLPALRLAALDQRWDRLEKDAAEDLTETFSSFMELMEDTWDETPPVKQRAEGSALIVGARGEIDAAASRYLGSVIERDGSYSVEVVSKMSGLTALSHARGTAYDIVIIVTVGGVEHQHLKFITRRALRDFPDASLLVLDWGSVDASAPDSEETSQAMVTTLAALIERLKYRSSRPGPAKAAELVPSEVASRPAA